MGFRIRLWLVLSTAFGGLMGASVTFYFCRGKHISNYCEKEAPAKPLPGNFNRQDLAQNAAPEKTNPRTFRGEREAGNYVLDLGNPDLVNRLSDRDKKLIASIMRSRGPVYEQMFTDMGVDSSTRDQLLHHISLVYQAKLDARKVLTQLTNAQADYNKRIKTELGSKYEEYRRFEEAGRARQESALVEEFAKNAELGPRSLQWSKLGEIIQASGAYSARTLGDLSGPFDELEKPIRGAVAVLRYNEQSQAALAVNAATVVKRARDLSFSSQEIELIEKYYGSQINYYERTISSILDPAGSNVRMLEERVAKMRTNPSAQPEAIRRLEKQLEMEREEVARQSSKPSSN